MMWRTRTKSFMTYNADSTWRVLWRISYGYGEYHKTIRRIEQDIQRDSNRTRHLSASTVFGAAQRLYEIGNVLPNKQLEEIARQKICGIRK
ncbi:hypothetical protein ALC53_06551 [Atta colombica]|uniref:Uncharacterized protein n=1 Tax=Atta colombica TaxID=520822 RepID=A0A195BFJ8_9HYME|nr:hypothetical protein ALC53_06551 [Atta colombica]